MKKVIVVLISLMCGFSVNAGEISSGGTISPLGMSLFKVKAILSEIDDTVDQNSTVGNIYPKSKDYYVVEIHGQDGTCMGNGFTITEGLDTFSSKADLTAVYKCKDAKK